MNITIPLYIEEQPQLGSNSTLFFVRPLFFYFPFVRDELLSRAETKLAQELRKHLGELGRQMRHDELAAYSFAPEWKEHFLKLSLDLGQQRVEARCLFVQLESFGKRIVFSYQNKNRDENGKAKRGLKVIDLANGQVNQVFETDLDRPGDAGTLGVSQAADRLCIVSGDQRFQHQGERLPAAHNPDEGIEASQPAGGLPWHVVVPV